MVSDRKERTVMDKDFQDALNVLAVYIVGDVGGLIVKFFVSILGTILLPFAFTAALFQ